MGSIQEAIPVKLIIGSLIALPALANQVAEDLAHHFGPIDLVSAAMHFNYTDYYAHEMGSTLNRFFYSFERLINPSELADIKVCSNRLERDYSMGTSFVKRPVNLDPGYLELGKLVLASTKNHSHRIYLKDGIYAEVTLIYRRKQFQALDWTYPDYRSLDYHNFFQKMRDRYHCQLLEGGLLRKSSESP